VLLVINQEERKEKMVTVSGVGQLSFVGIKTSKAGKEYARCILSYSEKIDDKWIRQTVFLTVFNEPWVTMLKKAKTGSKDSPGDFVYFSGKLRLRVEEKDGETIPVIDMVPDVAMPLVQYSAKEAPKVVADESPELLFGAI